MIVNTEITVTESSRGGYSFLVCRRYEKGPDGHPISISFASGWAQEQEAAEDMALVAVRYGREVDKPL